VADIVVTPLGPQDRARWAELWRGYLDFYETVLPQEIYDYTWQRLIAAESPIRGLGARLGSDTAPLVGIAHCPFHARARMWRPRHFSSAASGVIWTFSIKNSARARATRSPI